MDFSLQNNLPSFLSNFYMFVNLPDYSAAFSAVIM